MNISPSNNFKMLLLLARNHQNCQAILAAAGMNGLKLIGDCLSLIYIQQFHHIFSFFLF